MTSSDQAADPGSPLRPPPDGVPRRLHAMPVLLLLYAGAVLTALEYHFLPSRVWKRLVADDPVRAHQALTGYEAGITWAFATIIAFLVLPMVLFIGLGRRPFADFGFRLKGFLRHLPVYLGLYVLMLPAILWAASHQEFLATYPFVKLAREDLGVYLRWEAVYVVQFFALEAFFRGFLLFGLARRIGPYAVFVSALPYAMIHWHKPELEAYGALIAGVALGWLALRYRSWWGGAILHALVALTMDLLAVRSAGLF